MSLPPWMQQAACRGVDPAVFFPPPGQAVIATRLALSICGTCPVAAECLDYALDFESRPNSAPHGVYGGLTAQQRRALAPHLNTPTQEPT